MSIKTQFEVELNRLRDAYGDEIVNEAASDKGLMALAQSSNPEKKRKLFDQINKRFFKGEAPFGEPQFASAFTEKLINELADKLSQNQAAATKIHNLGGNITGIGRGEILMAYMISNCTIGGGSQNIDLTLFDEKGSSILDKAECKEAKKSNDGYLYGWRTAANHREYIDIARRDLNALYNALKDVHPSFSIQTPEGADIESKMSRGEGSGFIKVVKDIDPVIIQTPLTFDIKELDGDLIISKVGGQPIGSLSDKGIMRDIKVLLSSQNTTTIKSYRTIENELIQGMGSVKEKFIFVQSIGTNHKFGDMYYFRNLPGRVGSMKLDAFTGGTVKVRIKV